MKKAEIKKQVLQFPVFMGLFSAVGLLASIVLAIEKVHLLENPAAELSCSLNPVYSCQSVILSDQASILGFPNEFIGIAYYGGMLALALALFSGAKFAKWLYMLIWISLAGSMLFVFWFFYQSVFNIIALCIYCSIVWFATWALFVGYSRWLLEKRVIKVPKRHARVRDALIKYAVVFWLSLITLFVIIVLNHFWYYYGKYL